jgi:hypothetical protein
MTCNWTLIYKWDIADSQWETMFAVILANGAYHTEVLVGGKSLLKPWDSRFLGVPPAKVH